MVSLAVLTRMQLQQRLCSDCGEPIGPKRLQAIPDAHQCFDCANQAAGAAPVIAPPKSIPAKPMATTYHLKRYLVNVGQKTIREPYSGHWCGSITSSLTSVPRR